MFATSRGPALPVVVFAAALLGSVCATNDSTVHYKSQIEFAREFFELFPSSFRKGVVRTVYEAEVSTECQVFLLKFANAASKIEPWTSRRKLMGDVHALISLKADKNYESQLSRRREAQGEGSILTGPLESSSLNIDAWRERLSVNWPRSKAPIEIFCARIILLTE